MQILKMLEEGKINAGEAAKLLQSIEESRPDTPPGGRRVLRIRVEEAGRPAVSVNVPVSLAKVALKIAASFDSRLKEIDVDRLAEEIGSGVQGPLIEIERDRDKVVVTVEP